MGQYPHEGKVTVKWWRHLFTFYSFLIKEYKLRLQVETDLLAKVKVCLFY